MPDYIYLLESRLTPEQRAALSRVQEVAQAQDQNIYLVGGAVRDLICGMTIRDLDFVVEGSPFRIARELEKNGIRMVEEDERLRHVEMVFPGEVDGSIAAARDDVYDHPGAKPEIRWCTAIEDLRRRDFSINAIAISLRPASRGLVLDPTNGLADLEANHELRVLSIHSFTNQPVRLMRIVRYCTRMGFKMEQRTADWFALALERGLHENLAGEDVGGEVRQLTREEKAVAILKAWENRGLISAVHPQLKRRHPDYDGLAAWERVRDNLFAQGMRIPSSGSFAPVVCYLLGRLKPREQSSAISKMEFRRAEMEAIHNLRAEAERVIKLLKGPSRNLLPKGLEKKLRGKTAEARATYEFLDKQPIGLLAFIQAEYTQRKALSAIRTFLTKWKPLRAALPAAELENMGVARGPKFDKILEDLFNLQLIGRGRNPQDRTKLLRKLAGIKLEKKKEEKKKEEKKVRGMKEKAAPQPEKPVAAVPAPGAAAPRAAAEAKKFAKPEGKAPKPARPAKAKKAARRVKPPKRTKRAAKKTRVKKPARRRKR